MPSDSSTVTTTTASHDVLDDTDDLRIGPDLLDRLVDGMRRSRAGYRAAGESEGSDVVKGWGNDADGEVREEDVVSEAMLLL